MSLKDAVEQQIQADKQAGGTTSAGINIGYTVTQINITDQDLLAENERLRQFFNERRNRDNGVHPAKTSNPYRFKGEAHPQIIKGKQIFSFDFYTNCPLSFSKEDVIKFIVRDIQKGLLLQTSHKLIALDCRRGAHNWIAVVKLDGNSQVKILAPQMRVKKKKA